MNYYNYALNEAEVKSNYNGRNVSKAEGTWKFEESSKGIITLDSSGNGNDGILEGDVTRTEGAIRVHTGFKPNDSIDVTLTSVTLKDLNLVGLDVTDKKVIEKVDHSLEYVNNQRINIGAQINRLDFKKDEGETELYNYTETLGKIKNLDYAVETSNLLKTEILQQTVNAMFIKAKEYYQSSLRLLQV